MDFYRFVSFFYLFAQESFYYLLASITLDFAFEFKIIRIFEFPEWWPQFAQSNRPKREAQTQ